jgi:hypothetical protein
MLRIATTSPVFPAASQETHKPGKKRRLSQGPAGAGAHAIASYSIYRCEVSMALYAIKKTELWKQFAWTGRGYLDFD